MRRIIKKRYNEEEINLNITPFIDIVLSVLIVFMIPSQTLFGNIKLELPPANARIAVLEKDPVKVLITKDGNITIDGQQVSTNNLVNLVNEITLKNKNSKIYVIGDKRNTYERIMEIVGLLNDAGYMDVVLISDLYNRL